MTVEEVWYGRGPAAGAARAALRPLSLLYRAAVGLRTAAYDHGWKEAARAPAPVVSVGGLRVGGAGKTPFVLWLAERMQRRGLRPCVVTRGYGGLGDPTRPRLLEAAAGLTAAQVAEAGDEAALLALRARVPVALGSDRAEACAHAWRELSAAGRAPHLFLLDDGFQHRRLARDLDIVLVDGREPFEDWLPAGPLREGLGGLRRAGVVVIVGDGAPPVPGGAGQAVVRAKGRPCALVSDVADPGGEDPSTLAGRRVVAVAAIARPERFLASLEGLGARIVATVLRRDHHRYDAGDLREIAAAASSADLVVTTEKDLVKLGSVPGMVGPLRALRIELLMDDGDALADRVASLSRAPAPV